jgi:hypothetical protein
VGGRSVNAAEDDNIARLIALWSSPGYDTGGPVPPGWETCPDDAGVWAIARGGPMAAGHQASAARCERRWRENGNTETGKEDRS